MKGKMKPTFRVAFRRRRKNITDYRKRLYLLKSGKTRVVIRVQKSKIIIQFVDYDPKGDRVLFGSDSIRLLEKYSWYPTNNVPTAYLTGYVIGLIAKKKGITDAILDIGRFNKRNKKILAALKGLVDSGINIPHNPEIFPEEDRINGKILEEYAKSNPKFPEFNKYKEKGVDPTKLSKLFEETKKKIEKDFS